MASTRVDEGGPDNSGKIPASTQWNWYHAFDVENRTTGDPRLQLASSEATSISAGLRGAYSDVS
jgi:hypothetical protein